jgi:Serpin (serine protease inhibitor)
VRNVPAAADAALAADLFQILTEDAVDTVFSPASVASALRIALCGARGQTAAELARVLHLDEDPKPQDAAATGLRLELAPGGAGSGSATFRAPNTVWIQAGLPVRAAFEARLHDTVTLAAADFRASPEAARTEINRVIASQTEGKISGLLPSGTITALTRLVLASAVYLKAAWTAPFPERATADAPFYPDGRDQPTLTVPMMHGTASRAYLRGDGYQAVLLPYRDINLAMAVLLPDGPLAALRPKLAAAGLGGLLAGTRSRCHCPGSGWKRRSTSSRRCGGSASSRPSVTTRTSARSPRPRPFGSARSRTRPTSTSTSTALRRRRPPPWSSGRWPPCGHRQRSRWWWTGRSCSRSSTARPACRCSSARSAIRSRADQGSSAVSGSSSVTSCSCPKYRAQPSGVDSKR